MLTACAPARQTRSIGETAPQYVKDVVARGYQLAGGIAVLSSPEGDVLFVPHHAGIDEIDGEKGTVLRRHRHLLPDGDNVARDGRNLVLLSSRHDRVVVWDPVGVEVERHRGYAGPVNALRFDGALLIVEVERGGVSRQENDGDEATTFVTGMRAPAGLAGTARDLWVADRASGTVVQVVANGTTLVEPIEIARGLEKPEGLAVTLGGSLIVAETGAGRLLRIDPQARAIAVIDPQLALDPTSGSGRNPIGTFAGVAIGACGTIYVTADATGEIIRYVPQGPVVCRYGE
jgi:sugar lactone lactonase YvrE